MLGGPGEAGWRDRGSRETDLEPGLEWPRASALPGIWSLLSKGEERRNTGGLDVTGECHTGAGQGRQVKEGISQLAASTQGTALAKGGGGQR